MKSKTTPDIKVLKQLYLMFKKNRVQEQMNKTTKTVKTVNYTYPYLFNPMVH